jgi:hypothetical protein
MVNDHFIVEQTQWTQLLAKEIEHFICVYRESLLLGITIKLALSGRNFTNSLKHKVHECPFWI